MRLKTRIGLAFLAVAWIVVAAVSWVLTERMDAAFEQSFVERKGGVVDAVQRRLDGVSRDLDVALERMGHDPLLVRDLLEPLARGVFYDDGEVDYERVIVREARRLLHAPALDTLRLVDIEARPGHVIAVGHRAGAEPPDEEVVALVADAEQDVGRLGQAFFRKERVEDDASGAAVEVWTLQRVRALQGRVALVAGRVVDRALLEDLRVGAGPETHIALDDGQGARIAATFEGLEPTGEHVRGVHRIAREGAEEPDAVLSIFVSRAATARLTRELWTTAAWVGGAAALLALLMGLWSARRISRPLESLAEAASAVASGERTQRVPVLRGDDEVARLARAFNQMTAELVDREERLRQSERVAAWREIARRIAHEIKNPLFPIQMAIETLKKVWDRKHPDFEEIFEESTATILEEVERMKRIVTEFSNFARMPAPKPVPTDVAELVGQVLALLRETAPGVRMTQVGAEELVAEVDPDQIRQVVLNLVKNGIEALCGASAGASEGPKPAPEGAALEVRVEAEGGERFRVVITDNGPGMDEAVQAKLFVPYFTTRVEGTGLGLPIVHRIVAEHGGSIRVDSKRDVGTRFVLRLPRVAPA